jgi:putative phage-type endonuclease
MEQRSPEWFEARRGRITSSNVSCIMAPRGLGEAAKTYAKRIICELIQEHEEEQFVSFAMQEGIDNEPLAAEAYEMETFTKTTEIGFVTRGEHEGSSPDRLVGKDGLIEIKCPQTTNHINYLLLDECPKEHYDQIQHQLLCTDRLWCDFVSYNRMFKEEHQLKIIRVFPDKQWRETYETRLSEFMSLLEAFKIKLGVNINN